MNRNEEHDFDRLRLAAQVHGIGVFDLDHRTGAVYWSPQMHALCGTDPDSVPTIERWLAAVHAHDRDLLDKAVSKALAADGDGILQIEHRVVHPNGALRRLELRAQTSFEGEGADRRPARTLGTMIDVTDRKQREEALLHMGQRLREAVRVSGIGIFEHDHSAGRTYWSAEQRANYGWDPDEEVTLEKFMAQIHPDDRGQELATIRHANDPSGDGLFDNERRIVRRDGAIRWMRTRGRTTFDGPPGARRPVRTIGAVLDITDQRVAEAAMRRTNLELGQRVEERTAELAALSRRNERILEAAIDGFFVADAEGRIVEANPAYCRMFGWSRDELLHMTVAQLDADQDAGPMGGHLDRVIREGHDRFEAKRRCKDGTIIDVEVSASTIDANGRSSIIAFVRDISERKTAERALRAAKDEAERANRAKSDFLSRMSHELRTPLNAVLGFGQLLELEAGANEKRYSREIVRAGRHLLDLINEVLDLARIEAGALAVNPERVALEPLLLECLALVRPQADARGTWLPEALGSCAVEVMADRIRLKQVMLNLLSNAIKFGKERGVVEVSCECDAEPLRPWVRIRVTDSGEGLSVEQRARLFVPFERLGADARGIEGTGIGLALSKRLAEMMDGAIGVDSAPGAGCTFWVRLPMAAAAGGDAPVPAESGAVLRAPRAAAGAASRVDVLCIEDNPTSLRLVEHVLARRSDVRLLSAIAPGLGLELARARRPALILLDINLPDMDGWAVMKCLRENEATRDIPVVALSASAMPGDVERGKAAGFVDYLTKPLSVAGLMEVVDRIVRAREPPGRE